MMNSFLLLAAMLAIHECSAFVMTNNAGGLFVRTTRAPLTRNAGLAVSGSGSLRMQSAAGGDTLVEVAGGEEAAEAVAPMQGAPAKGAPLRSFLLERRVGQGATATKLAMENAGQRNDELQLLVDSLASWRGYYTENFLEEPEKSILKTDKTEDLPGNKNFDPLGLADKEVATGDRLDEGDDSALLQLAESEIKHCRLAMLAFSSFIFPKLLNIEVSDYMNAVFFVFTCFELLEVQNYKDKLRNDQSTNVPGDLGFDPLKIYMRGSTTERYVMRYREINNGRLAMAGMLVYWLQSAPGALFSNAKITYKMYDSVIKYNG